MRGVGNCKIQTPIPLPCLIPSSLVVITSSGNVLPCFEDYLEKNVMGNILDSTLAEIWNLPNYVAFRQGLKAKQRGAFPVCKDCNNILISPRASGGWGPCQECNGESCAILNEQG